jgi:hypothetical protein
MGLLTNTYELVKRNRFLVGSYAAFSIGSAMFVTPFFLSKDLPEKPGIMKTYDKVQKRLSSPPRGISLESLAVKKELSDEIIKLERKQAHRLIELRKEIIETPGYKTVVNKYRSDLKIASKPNSDWIYLFVGGSLLLFGGLVRYSIPDRRKNASFPEGGGEEY